MKHFLTQNFVGRIVFLGPRRASMFDVSYGWMKDEDVRFGDV